jgi:hypothetical protein
LEIDENCPCKVGDKREGVPLLTIHRKIFISSNGSLASESLSIKIGI